MCKLLLGYALSLIYAEANNHLHCIHICFLARNVSNAQTLMSVTEPLNAYLICSFLKLIYTHFGLCTCSADIFRMLFHKHGEIRAHTLLFSQTILEKTQNFRLQHQSEILGRKSVFC